MLLDIHINDIYSMYMKKQVHKVLILEKKLNLELMLSNIGFHITNFIFFLPFRLIIARFQKSKNSRREATPENIRVRASEMELKFGMKKL